MKLDYTWEEVERWRHGVHHRGATTLIKNKNQALRFINRVGYCFAFKSDSVELPSLWQAVTGFGLPPGHAHHPRKYYLSYAWEIRDILPEAGAIYYGKVIRGRPSVVSLEFLPYFYALTERSGLKGDYQTEYTRGRLSGTAKSIMDVLSKRSPQPTKELKHILSRNGKSDGVGFDKAIDELQTRMFVTKVLEQGRSHDAEWATVRRCFPAQVKMARAISIEVARERILEKYFQNQLVTSVPSIQRLFRWPKQVVYQTLGKLVHKGIITANVRLDGQDSKYYCLIR